MLLAQLSDCHVSIPGEEFSDLYHSADRLREAIRHVNEGVNRPDLVVLTGDLINAARRDEYELLREIVKDFEMPYYLMPGNHDHCALLREIFSDHDYLPREGKLHYVIDGWPLKLICLDTNIHGKPQGELGAAQLDWLEAELAGEKSRNCLIFMHHPPFRTGLTSMDNMGLLDMEAFIEVISRHDHIERVLSGHLHRAIQRLSHGTLIQVCPSTSHQVELSLGDNNSLATVFEPPEYLLHYWTEADGLVTHSEFVKDYGVAWRLAIGGIGETY
ncbi:MAG: phosphodiesterase [Alphaproteobacteria bacterium]|nr:MAG: phosphodiesterase [Alphaproteobacteria bacterium]